MIVLDNLSCHKTKKLYEFYQKNKINIIFNTLYLSDFNSIELSFRNLKKQIYSKIYTDSMDMINDAKNILQNPEFNNSIKYNFGETLEKYWIFSLDKKREKISSFKYV